MKRVPRITAAIALAALAAAALAAPVTFEPLRGYVDLGITTSDALTSGLEAGPGKLRQGEERELEVEPVLAEARVIGALALGSAWRAVLDLKYDDFQRHTLDIGEAYLGYRSAPRPHGVRWRLKAGTFLPPFSLENRAIGWTSPHSLSSSVLNTWIGEELRINGAEARVLVDRDGWQGALAGAAYFANDTAGTVLGYRGFALHDRELGLFDRMRIPRYQVGLFDPRSAFRLQSRFYEPLHELDQHPGFYAGATLSDPLARRFELYYYNNAADPEALNRTAGAWAWRTRFWVAGFASALPWGVHFLTQAMLGDTAMGRRRALGRRLVESDFFTGYGLVTKGFAWADLSVRGEYFEMRDKDGLRAHLDNAESGFALTATATRKLGSRLKLYVEYQYTDHERPARALAGLPADSEEWLLRANLRWFF